MKFAFYKGKGSFLDWVIRTWMRGKYSHCEVVLDELGSEGLYQIASSVPGVGVRTTVQKLPSDEWDIIEAPGDLAAARKWFSDHDGAAYDYLGLFGFVLRPATINSKDKFWCSEACLLAVGYPESWREDPNGMYDIIAYSSKEYLNNHLTTT